MDNEKLMKAWNQCRKAMVELGNAKTNVDKTKYSCPELDKLIKDIDKASAKIGKYAMEAKKESRGIKNFKTFKTSY